MRSHIFKGTGVALITPFSNSGEVDYNSLKKLIEHQIEGGIDYLVALGTTAETPTLSKTEKLKILDTVFEVNDGRLPVAIGAGGNNTPEVIKWINELESFNYDGLLSVTPYYNKPNQKALIAHFSEIAKSTSKNIILYNVPGRTGCNMLANTTVELAAKFENINCIKEASGNLSQIMDIENNAPDDFYILSGDDALTLPMISVGAKGVISVIAQAYPKQYSSMVNSALNGEFGAAKDLHYHLLNITNSIYDEGNPVGIKSLLNQLNLCENVVRLPLIKSSAQLDEKIKGFTI